MPARSNAFQRAMFLLRQKLADAETDVTESAFLKDPRTNTPREVDILVGRRVAGTEILIGIECTDLKDPADVGWVEKMHGKHSHLPTHALVLASGSGFTNEAQKIADALNITTVRIGDMDERLTKKVVGVLRKVYAKASRLTILQVNVTLEAEHDLEEETIVTASDQLVYDENGQEIGPLQPIVVQWLQTDEVGAYLLRDALPAHKFYTIDMRDPVVPGTTRSLYLEKIEPNRLRRIKLFEIHGGLTLSLWEVPLKHATVDGRPVAWGEGVSDDGSSTVTLLVDETPDDSNVVLHVEGKKTKTKKAKSVQPKPPLKKGKQPHKE